MVLCKMSTYNITTHHGECLQDCPHGAWNGPEGICGAECLECVGTLYLTKHNSINCDGGSHQCKNKLTDLYRRKSDE